MSKTVWMFPGQGAQKAGMAKDFYENSALAGQLFDEADAALDARDGVYASRVEVDGRMYDAMSNLGYKPTVDGRRRLLETNIFGFEGDLYGRRLRVELLRFIRPERRFGSVEELFRQIGDDRREVCGGGGEPLDPQ